ncbi:MAG: riboflavin biosynthesis protein RibF [Lachnospirales bacterium]
MQIIENDFSIQEESIVFIGNFDGVHRGHMSLVKSAIEIKKENKNLVTVALSFFPHSKAYFQNKNFQTIFTLEEKAIAFKRLGVDYLKICNFNKENQNLLPYDFISKYIVQQLKAKYVVVGSGFLFGRDRAGNIDVLIEICKSFNIKVISVAHLPSDNENKISSSDIREFICSGDIEKANNLLGEPYFAYGKVVSGKKLGRTIGFPTANIDVSDYKLLPPKGVYKTVTTIEGKKYNSITNVGINPTFNEEKQVIETHLFDFDEDIYNKEIIVDFFEYIRPEKKFNNIEELKNQIITDTKKVKYI